MATESKYDNYDYPSTNPESGEGHPGHTTPEQDEKLAQLRKELEEEGYTERLDTLTMLRFLRARKFDVALAKQMFIDCEKWRKDFKVDEIVKDFVYVEKPKVFEWYPQYYHKNDKDGRPVYIEQLGKIDLAAILKITTEERMLQNLVLEYERLASPRLPACSRKAGKLLETCCTIMDLKGVGVTSIPQVYGFVRKVSAISQNYYPERLGKLYIINAPWGFAGAFSMVKGFLDPVTVNKINVLGGRYQQELLAQIPAENLPVEFGGTCSCEGGCALSDMGPWKEEAYMSPAEAAILAEQRKQIAEAQNAQPTLTATAPPPEVADKEMAPA